MTANEQQESGVSVQVLAPALDRVQRSGLTEYRIAEAREDLEGVARLVCREF